MENRSITQLTAQNKRLRFTVALLVVLIGVVTTLLMTKVKQDDKLFTGVGEPIESKSANGYVEKYTDGIFVLDGSTTSFLLEKRLLDSFSTNPAASIPTYYRIFFAKNPKGKKTLVITGAYLDSQKSKIINTHIKGGYDIEHVFPIDDAGNVYKLNQNGERDTPIWSANRLPL